MPTAALLPEPRAPCVLKADGLAAGKGVIVCRTEPELAAGLEAARAFGGPVLVEELLEGPEASLFAICDGGDAIALAPARDYKRAFDGDDGPNTGGMGSFAPTPRPRTDEVDGCSTTCVRPVLARARRREGRPSSGRCSSG